MNVNTCKQQALDNESTIDSITAPIKDDNTYLRPIESSSTEMQSTYTQTAYDFVGIAG